MTFNVFNFRQPLSPAAESVIGQVMLASARAEKHRPGLPKNPPAVNPRTGQLRSALKEDAECV